MYINTSLYYIDTPHFTTREETYSDTPSLWLWGRTCALLFVGMMVVFPVQQGHTVKV